jgi:hypothetical protein
MRHEQVLHFPDDFEFIPTRVTKQLESSNNYYFRVSFNIISYILLNFNIIFSLYQIDLPSNLVLY